MRIYRVLLPPPRRTAAAPPPVLLRDGVSGWGLLFGPWALLARRAWLCALLAGTAELLALLAATHLQGGWVSIVAVHLAVATFGADWTGWELRQAGYAAGQVVAGANRSAALLRLIEHRPDLFGRPA